MSRLNESFVAIMYLNFIYLIKLLVTTIYILILWKNIIFEIDNGKKKFTIKSLKCNPFNEISILLELLVCLFILDWKAINRCQTNLIDPTISEKKDAHCGTMISKII